ncbi:MAG: toll/interleukin-1 receptor domain-containing protein [Pseudomonadota bacterium]
MGENADTHPDRATPAPAGPYDVYLVYTDSDEDIAKALQQELHRQRPGLRVWREKRRIGVGDAFNQAADMAIAGCSVVLAIWTKHAARSGAFTLEARRAMTLRKPFVNLLADVPASALAPPYSKYSAFEIDEVFALAGRSEGWVPPSRPHKDDLEDELKPVLDRVTLHMRQNADQASAIADGLITGVIEAAGEPHTAKFETMLKSIAPGDPATAIEVLGLADYSEAEINTLLSPQSVRVASRTEDEKPLPFGAWYVRPHVRKIEPVHKDNGMLYAVGGFLVAGLGALALWIMGSTLSTPAEPSILADAAPASGPASTGTTPVSDPMAVDSLLPPARNAAALENCALNTDGSITGAPCRLSTNIAPLIGPDANTDGVDPIATAAAERLDACIVSLGGAIENAPCRLNARYVPPAIPVPDAVKPPCIAETDGSILNVPCTLEGAFEAPEPERIEVEVPVEPEPAKLCAVNADGSIDDAPCMLASALAAPEPQRVEIPVPADAPAPESCIIGLTGEVSNAPCLLTRNLEAPEPERIEVPGETVVESLPTCEGLTAGSEIREGCKLDRNVQLAYRACNSDTSNAPCTVSTPLTRFAAGDEPGPSGGPDTSRAPVTSVAAPRRGDFPPRPLNMPDTLEPCEEVITVPCRFSVEKAGLDTLTEIAESFYGNTQAWCRIYRANEGTFGTRNQARRGSDPNCIFMSDVFDLPPGNADNRYSLQSCPPAQPTNRCLGPFE